MHHYIHALTPVEIEFLYAFYVIFAFNYSSLHMIITVDTHLDT